MLAQTESLSLCPWTLLGLITQADELEAGQWESEQLPGIILLPSWSDSALLLFPPESWPLALFPIYNLLTLPFELALLLGIPGLGCYQFVRMLAYVHLWIFPLRVALHRLPWPNFSSSWSDHPEMLQERAGGGGPRGHWRHIGCCQVLEVVG